MFQREIVHFDFANNGTMGIIVKFLPIPKFPTFTIPAEHLQFDPERAELRYTIKGKRNESVWKIIYTDGDTLAAKCSVHIGLVAHHR